MGKSGPGKAGGSAKAQMTAADAARIQSAGARHPRSETARSGFSHRISGQWSARQGSGHSARAIAAY